MSAFDHLSDDQLVDLAERANHAYRNGLDLVLSDSEYDQVFELLRRRQPYHPFVTRPEPESDWGRGRVRHTTPMLSTDKVYTDEELQQWCRRIDKAASRSGVATPVAVKVTAKLDGVAARYYPEGVLATRGDEGVIGNDISHLIGLGVEVAEGDGELVLDQAYFDRYLSFEFKHPRGVITGSAGADEMRESAIQAFADGAVQFMRFQDLESRQTDTARLAEQLDQFWEELLSQCPYPTDGLVIEATDPDLKKALGATEHHHRWMVAVKEVTDTAQVPIHGVSLQVGRTGRVTPVAHFEPCSLSGAVVSNATVHHAGRLRDWGIGDGAVVEVTRSGEVIPKITKVIESVDAVDLPDHCPSCSHLLVMEGDFLLCQNLSCPERASQRLQHFFHILGTVDLFGPVTCDTLVGHGITLISETLELDEEAYQRMGFGPGQSANLVKEINEARRRPVEDARLLAAFGIDRLGRGDSKKLLKHYRLESVFDLDARTIEAIKGFGEITAHSFVNGFRELKDEMARVIDHFEVIERTASASASQDSPITGKNIVFTGTMEQGSRDDMKAHAESLGASIQTSVNGKTDLLVAGAKTGAAKLEKARQHGTQVVDEQQYRAMIG